MILLIIIKGYCPFCKAKKKNPWVGGFIFVFNWEAILLIKILYSSFEFFWFKFLFRISWLKEKFCIGWVKENKTWFLLKLFLLESKGRFDFLLITSVTTQKCSLFPGDEPLSP